MIIRITKKQVLFNMNTTMTTYKQFLVNFKIYNDLKTFSKKGKFVKTIFHNDLFEYSNKEYLTKKEQESITNEILIDIIHYYCNDFENTKELKKYCDNTIKEYNKQFKNYKY